MAKHRIPTQEHKPAWQLFGSRYKRYRERLKVSQKDLATYVNRSNSAISKIEGGTYLSLDLDSVCARDAVLFVSLGVFENATELVDWLGLVFGPISEADVRKIVQWASQSEPSLDSPTGRAHAQIIAEFSKTIPDAFQKLSPKPPPESGDGISAISETAPSDTPITMSEVTAPSTELLTDVIALDEQQLSVIDMPNRSGISETAEGALSEPDTLTASSASSSLTEWVYEPLPIEDTVEGLLTVDEVYMRILQGEDDGGRNRLADIWNMVGDMPGAELLSYPDKLDFFIAHWEGEKSRVRIGHAYLESVIDETTRRLQSTSSAAFDGGTKDTIVSIGKLALEAIQQSEQPNLLQTHLSPGQDALLQSWVRLIEKSDITRIVVDENGTWRFLDQEQAEYWAARYLLNQSLDPLLEIARNQGRPFGVLWQAVRFLHFTGRHADALRIMQELLNCPEHPNIMIRYLDTAELLAACEGRKQSAYQGLYEIITATLSRLWVEIEFDEWRDSVAHVMRRLDCELFRTAVTDAFQTSRVLSRNWVAALRAAGIMGGQFATQLLTTTANRFAFNNEKNLTSTDLKIADEVRQTIIAAAERMPPTQHAQFLSERLKSIIDRISNDRTVWLPDRNQRDEGGVVEQALPTAQDQLLTARIEEDSKDSIRILLGALQGAGTIPALRALDNARQAHGLNEAIWMIRESDSPAYAALVARKLEAHLSRGEAPLELIIQSSRAMERWKRHRHYGWPGYAQEGVPRSLAKALARVWANVNFDNKVRTEAARGLMTARPAAAFRICLSTLPLVNQPEPQLIQAGILPDLLLALTNSAARDILRTFAESITDPIQQSIIIRCLGRAGGLSLQHLDAAMAGQDERVSIAAIEGAVESLGPKSIERLKDVFHNDLRESVKVIARKALARLGSLAALEGLTSSQLAEDEHLFFEVANIRQPAAERMLIEVAQMTKPERLTHLLCMQALAKSSSPAAIRELRRLFGTRTEAIGQLQMELPPESGRWARDVWSELLTDSTKDWRDLATQILLRDGTEESVLAVIEAAFADDTKLSLRDTRWIPSDFFPAYPSERIAMCCLSAMRNVHGNFTRSPLACRILAKSLEGLAAEGRRLPAYLRDEVLKVLVPEILSRGNEAVRREIILILGRPDFSKAARDITKVASSEPTDPELDLREAAVRALAGIGSQESLSALVKLSRTPQAADLADFTRRELAVRADYKFISGLPKDMSPTICLASILRKVRFQKRSNRYSVIHVNGRVESLGA